MLFYMLFILPTSADMFIASVNRSSLCVPDEQKYKQIANVCTVYVYRIVEKFQKVKFSKSCFKKF